MKKAVHIIGGGLAGSEAAWTAARAGFEVVLHEMRPGTSTPAHQGGDLAELVCSNSLKSEDPLSASWLLKREMADLGSLSLEAAAVAKVPSGLNLSVDREVFAREITAKIASHPLIRVVRERVDSLPAERPLIVATGPLTGEALASELSSRLGQAHLYFFDAIAPIVNGDSLDRTKIFEASRWGKGEADYLNCPLDKAQYEAFIDALLKADKHPFHGFEEARFFEGCMPIEDLAERGRETLRFGPMKPVGLIDPATGRRPWACVQLRRENAVGTLFNLVGFQTRMKWGAQDQVLRLIPGLEKVEFVRFGSLHRNTFLNAPVHLHPGYGWKSEAGVFFAGQITGVEGYLESAASGILAGINAVRLCQGLPAAVPPRNSMLGSLVHYQAASDPKYFQPINATWGLVEPLEGIKDKKERQAAYVSRARTEFADWMSGLDLNRPVAAANS